MYRHAVMLLGSSLVALTSVTVTEGADESRVAYMLPSGLRVRLTPDTKAQSVVVLLAVRAGICEEHLGQPHLAHVTEHMLAFGAREGSPEAAAMTRWFEAGKANGETTASMMYFDLQVAPNELETALRLEAARLSAPSFTRERLATEAPRALSEVTNLERSEQIFTGKFACSAFVQAAFYEAPRIPIKTKTGAYTVDDVREFWSRTFRPDRAILCIAGRFDQATVRKQVDASFGKIPAPKPTSREKSVTLKPGRSAAKWDVATRHLFLAWPAPAPPERDNAALTLASLLLSEQLMTNTELAARASFPRATNDVNGLFLIDLPTKPGAEFDKLEAKALDIVARLAKADAPAPIQVAQASMALTQMLEPINLDTIPLPPNVTREMALGNLELRRLGDELAQGDLASFIKRLKAVDAESLRSAVARHLDPAKATIVQLEPEK